MAKGQKGLMKNENLLGQMREMQQHLQVAQKELEKEQISADVRGGAVKITFSGAQECKAVEIAPEFLKTLDAAALEGLMVEVINKGLDKVRKHTVKKLGPISGLGR